MNKRKVLYHDSVVSFVDILGFRELIEKRRPGEISKILRLLAESHRPPKSVHAVEFTHFSDTVIRSTPTSRNIGCDLFFEILSLINSQRCLIQQGIVLRGAVTIGEVTKSWGLTYGPAVVKAYDLEKKANFPRIVIDPDSLSRLRNSPVRPDYQAHIDDLTKNASGLAFLNYLKFRTSEKEDLAFLKEHKTLVVQGLRRYAADRHKLQKYEWLRDYHNSTIAENHHLDSSNDLRI